MPFNRQLTGLLPAIILIAIYATVQLPKQGFFAVETRDKSDVSLGNENSTKYILIPIKKIQHEDKQKIKYHKMHKHEHDLHKENTTMQLVVSADVRSDRSRDELDLITKKLNKKYKYEGPGFGKSNFIELESLSSALYGEKHNYIRKNRKGVNNP